MSEGVQILITERGGQLVAQRFSALENGLGRVGATGARTSRTLRNVLTRDINVLGGALGKLSALAGGLGFAKVAKDTLDWSGKLANLQVEARATNADMRSIEAQVMRTAKASGVMADELLASLLQFQTYGGILAKGRASLGDIVAMHKATGASMEDLTSIAAVLFKTMQLGPEEAKKAFAELRAMSIAGTISVKGQAETLPGLLALTGAYGYKGLRGVRQMAGMQQVLGEAGGGLAGETSTMVQALFRSLTKNQGGLRGAGVEVYANKKTGEFRDVGDIMLSIFRNKRIMETPGVLGKLFPREALRAAAALRTQFDPRTKGWRTGSNMDTVFGAAGGAQWKDIEADAALRKSGPGAAAAAVAKRRAQLDAWLKGTGMDVAGFVMENPGMTAALLGGGFLGMKSAPALAKLLLGRGKGGKGGALAGLGGGATPVMVMNWPAGFGAPGGAPGAPAAAPGSQPGGKGIGLVAAGTAGAIGVGVGLAANAVLGRIPGADAARDRAVKFSENPGAFLAEAGSERKRQQAILARAGASPQLIASLSRLPGVIEKMAGHFERLASKPPVTVAAKGGLDKVEVAAGRGSAR